MKLKRIEVKGFKSFVDRTSVIPAEGITCVVGPNGSGKSNITDAIRWVLGEQSAKVLRGEKMEDVIFSGTGKRKSLGFAEVELVFDNEDRFLPLEFNEVSVLRKLYRSGESEYRINDAQVRLKDVRDLFADTGIGREGYSIIAQGRIDEIISSSPENRRILFDEAAGITRFKQRKTESERRLSAAETDMREVGIRLTEIENVLEPLKIEAERAEVYRVKSARLREAGIYDGLKSFQNQLASVQKIETLIAEVLEKKAHIDEACRNADEGIREIEAKQDAVRTEFRDANARSAELLSRLRQVEMEILLGDEKIFGAEKQLKSIRALSSAGEQSRIKLLSEKEALEAELRTAEEALAAITESKNQLAATRDAHHDELSLASEELRELAEKERQFEAKLAEAERKLEGNRKEIAEIEAEYEKDALKEREDERNRAQIEYQSAQEEEHRLKEALSALETRLTEQRKQLTELEKESAKAASELEFHQRLLNNYDGYDSGVKRLMGHRDKSILGVVGELFETEKKYETAIETALGRNINVVVCERVDDAKRFIEQLRRSKEGRVSFFPLESVKKVSQQEIKDSGFEGYASDLISCDPQFRMMFENLLGGIVVATDFDAARKLVRHGKRVVTLSGEVFLPTGIITGGTTSTAKILFRRRMVAELGDQKVQLEKDLKTGTVAYAELEHGYADQRALLVKSSERSARARLELASAEASYEHELKSSESRRMRYVETRGALIAENADLEQWLGGSGEERDDIAQGKAQAAKRLEEVQGRLKEGEERLVDRRLEEATLKEKYQGMSKRQQSISADLEATESEKTKLEEEVGRILAEIVELKEKADELTKEKASIQPDMDALTDAVAKFEHLMEELEHQRKERVANHRTLLDERSEVQNLVANTEAKKIRVEGELQQIRSEMMLLYEVTVEEAQAMELTPLSRAEFKELKQEVEEMGDVNLAAPKEYAAQLARRDEVLVQKVDIEKAIANVRATLDELSKKIEAQFKEGFEKIQVSFRYAFQRLFGGGEAELVLVGDAVDGEDSGIEINVQPPGKKLKSLSLLSGGEKALTAIALTFAFLEINPSPFCVLDEIEAPLDDVNLMKFTEFLKDYAEKSQFIVITHRRATMDVADAIFGVTMEEYGVSKVLSMSTHGYKE